MTRGGNIGLGVSFQPGLQEGLINSRGSQLLHEVALACTCRSADLYSGLHDDGKERRRDPHCPRCGGSGWLYRDPLVMTGLAVSIRQQRNIMDAGIAQPGDMTFSPQLNVANCSTPNRRITAYDKFTALWSQTVDDGQVIVRGAGTRDDNKHRITHLLTNEDRLWYEPESATWCEDEDNVRYREGADFKLGPGKLIRWLGAQPALGKKYTIKYNAHFEWIVFAPPQERRDRDNADLGQLCMLRKRHIAYVNDNPTGTPADNVTLQSRINC